jgi:DMSO/TMAO reductase YedYZ molybdopterin-dependent catalytic subunit
VSSAARGQTDRKSGARIAVGRRVFLGMGVLGAAGIVFGAKVQNVLGSALGSGLGGLLPGGNRFRIYTVSGSYPKISESEYRLEISGLVDNPQIFTLADLKEMPPTSFVQEFQCVTGWTVSDVHWEGVKLSDILDKAGVKAKAVALSFESYDNTDYESLTLEQARLPDVIVAYRMLGAPVTVEHGGPVRLYVGPMFGYKSLKWLSAIRVVDQVIPGFWELRGYPVNGWRDGSTGPTDKSLT